MSDKHAQVAFSYPTRAGAMFVESPTDLLEGQEAALLVNKQGELRVDVSGGVTIGSLSIVGTTKTILRAPIDIATSGDHTIIAAPGGGNTIKIIQMIYQNTSGSTVTVLWKDGAVGDINGLGFVHSNEGGFAFDAPGGPGFGEIILSDDEPFILNLSGNNQVSGYVIYRKDA